MSLRDCWDGPCGCHTIACALDTYLHERWRVTVRVLCDIHDRQIRSPKEKQ
jgi:hypothetical protein